MASSKLHFWKAPLVDELFFDTTESDTNCRFARVRVISSAVQSEGAAPTYLHDGADRA
jgi:hypothetical protein